MAAANSSFLVMLMDSAPLGYEVQPYAAPSGSAVRWCSERLIYINTRAGCQGVVLQMRQKQVFWRFCGT